MEVHKNPVIHTYPSFHSVLLSIKIRQPNSFPFPPRARGIFFYHRTTTTFELESNREFPLLHVIPSLSFIPFRLNSDFLSQRFFKTFLPGDCNKSLLGSLRSLREANDDLKIAAAPNNWQQTSSATQGGFPFASFCVRRNIWTWIYYFSKPYFSSFHFFHFSLFFFFRFLLVFFIFL